MLKQWPHFSYDKEVLAELEFTFSQNSGTILGVFRHIQGISKDDFIVEILSNEALKTSEIEGENLDRESLQSSIKKHLGLSVENRKVSPAEYGISEMMVDLYLNFNTPISHALLYQWHEMITNGRRDLANIGQYRTHEAPMQIVSGSIDNPKIHFEAPPSKEVFNEMEQFINWFNSEHERSEKSKFCPLAKAGISHLYFESIHPFEDGNGRIGRAIAEKSIAMSLKQPSLISLSHTIEIHKKNYYQSLEKSNITLEITDWLVYFGRTIFGCPTAHFKTD
ncbi:MAG: DUF4172 domain-containing protein [Bacteroidales bacterium]|nr:DUF4172 domain-containing protein [Bacteroidales bacterium]